MGANRWPSRWRQTFAGMWVGCLQPPQEQGYDGLGEGLAFRRTPNRRTIPLCLYNYYRYLNAIQIWPGSSGSGSRTGMSGFSGGLSGSLIGGGAGSAGVRQS
jgi:hypothetical protein